MEMSCLSDNVCCISRDSLQKFSSDFHATSVVIVIEKGHSAITVSGARSCVANTESPEVSEDIVKILVFGL